MFTIGSDTHHLQLYSCKPLLTAPTIQKKIVKKLARNHFFENARKYSKQKYIRVFFESVFYKVCPGMHLLSFAVIFFYKYENVAGGFFMSAHFETTKNGDKTSTSASCQTPSQNILPRRNIFQEV